MKLDVKPGDKLAIRRSGVYSGIQRVVEVERVTATQAACKCGTRLMLRSGDVVGSGAGFSRQWAEVITPEIEAQIHRQRVNKWAAEQAQGAICRLSVDRIEQVRTLIEKLTAEQAAQGESK